MLWRLSDQRTWVFASGLRSSPYAQIFLQIPQNFYLCSALQIMKNLNLILSFRNRFFFLRICGQVGNPGPLLAPEELDLSWMLALYQIMISITCWHQWFQITIFITSSPVLNCPLPTFCVASLNGRNRCIFTIKWSWPDTALNILSSHCSQLNTSRSEFWNHRFLLSCGFSIPSQFFSELGCTSGAIQSKCAWLLSNANILWLVTATLGIYH